MLTWSFIEMSTFELLKMHYRLSFLSKLCENSFVIEFVHDFVRNFLSCMNNKTVHDVFVISNPNLDDKKNKSS